MGPRKIYDDFRTRADDLREDLHLHGTTIAGAVRTNSMVIALVAVVSVIALILGVKALRTAK